MAEHDEEALLQEELDLDYEVDEELPEEELLGENDEFVLSGDEAYNEEHVQSSQDGGNEAHTTNEQEEDVLDLGVTDTGIDELEEDGLQNSQQDHKTEEKKERDRFRSERPNTSGHKPIVFDTDSTENVVSSNTQKNPKFQRHQNFNFRGRGGRGGVGQNINRGNFRQNINRGNFHNVQNNNNRIHSRLGQRPQQLMSNNLLRIPPQTESKKVLINPHFRGNVKPKDARLVWDAQVQPPYQQQPFQNMGNFSHPQQQIQHAPNVIAQSQGPWNTGLLPQGAVSGQQPIIDNSYPGQLGVNGPPIPVVTIPNIQQQQQQPEIFRNDAAMMPQQVHFESPPNPQLGSMFVNNSIPQQTILTQQNYEGDWYNTGNEAVSMPSYSSQSDQHFKIPTQSGYRNRDTNRIGGRFQNNTVLRAIPTDQDRLRQARNNVFPQRVDSFNPQFVAVQDNVGGFQQNNIQPALYPQQQNDSSFFENRNIAMNTQIGIQPQTAGFNQNLMAQNHQVPFQQNPMPQQYNNPGIYLKNDPPSNFPQNNFQLVDNSAFPHHQPTNMQVVQQENRPFVVVNQATQVRLNEQQPHLTEFTNNRVIRPKRTKIVPVKNKRQFHNQTRMAPKRPSVTYSNETVIKKKKSLDFRTLQEIPRVDVPDTTVFEDKTPQQTTTKVPDEEEDEETRAYRQKIEEQRKLREQILKQKEERRKKAAAQAANSANSSEVTTTTTPTIKHHQNPPTVLNKPVAQTLSVPLRKLVKTKQPNRTLVPLVHKSIPNKNRLVVLNTQKQAAITKPVNRNPNLLKIEKKIDVMPNTVSSTQITTKPIILTKRVVRAIPRQSVTTVVTAKTAITDDSSESDDVINKEHLSSFLSTRTVVPKTTTVVNGTISNINKTLLKTNVVKISNLAASTTELKLRKLCKGVALIQSIQMLPNLGQAVIRFKNIAHAHNFYKKYQRKMIDLSLIDVQLVPSAT